MQFTFFIACCVCGNSDAVRADAVVVVMVEGRSIFGSAGGSATPVALCSSFIKGIVGKAKYNGQVLVAYRMHSRQTLNTVLRGNFNGQHYQICRASFSAQNIKVVASNYGDAFM
jgi:hypothetical protein